MSETPLSEIIVAEQSGETGGVQADSESTRRENRATPDYLTIASRRAGEDRLAALGPPSWGRNAAVAYSHQYEIPFGNRHTEEMLTLDRDEINGNI